MARALNVAALLLTLACVAAVAAPGPKPLPDPDHVTGPLARRLDSPVVLVTDPDGRECQFWLVFPNQAREAEALRGVEYGDRVTARGRLGTGGAYRYLAVATLDKD